MSTPRITYNVKAVLSEFLQWLSDDQPNLMHAQDRYPSLYMFCKNQQILATASIAKAILPLHTKDSK